MKKTLFTIALLGMVMLSFGQKVTIGLKGGINSTKITTDSDLSGIGNYTWDDFKSDLNNGYNLGAFARIGKKKVYLQPELLYSVVKGKSEINLMNSETPLSATQKLNVKSVQIPVLLGYRLLNFKIASVRAFTGPAMSIVLDGSESRIDQAVVNGFKADQLKDNIWDWQLGAGVDIANFVFDVRYAWGISNITDGDFNFVNKGNTLTFSVGFKIF